MSLRLNPDNPHYLEMNGRPLVLIGSGEHYGAVMNLDFDYRTYLRSLQGAGLNQTRLFAGTYREVPGSFGIAHNTLAPAPDRYVCPWARSGDRFDLERFDDAYFARLSDFIETAASCGVAVELVLFCFFYNEELWRASPLWSGNNVNGVGDCDVNEAFLPDTDLLPAQRALVRKLAQELNRFDNLYYEIINEPYVRFDGEAFEPWQGLIADTLAAAEDALPKQHLIAQNIHNRTARVKTPHPRVDIFNFHYALPSAVGDNYHFDRPIANDETGFAGQTALPYRREAWLFVLAGGSIVSHLDYSFTVEHPDGSSTDFGDTPGFGGPELRKQLRILKEFVESFDFLRLEPCNEIVRRVESDTGAQVMALGTRGEQYALYVAGGSEVEIDLGIPPGTYRVEWVDTVGGEVTRSDTVEIVGRGAPFRRNRITSPPFTDDIAIRVLSGDE